MSAERTERLEALRRWLEQRDLDGFILPRGDEHLGEYVAPYAERLAWLTGFTGSAGAAVALRDAAAVFSDGRYTLQLAMQVDNDRWERHHIVQHPPADWLAARAERAGRTLRVAIDPWLLSEDGIEAYRRPGIELVPVAANPVDAIWSDRPTPTGTAIRPHGPDLSGTPSAEKRAAIAAVLDAAGQDAAVLTDPASVAWLLNLRARDIEFTPFALGFVLLDRSGRATLFAAPDRLAADTRAFLGNEVAIRAPDELEAALRELSGKRVRIDRAGAAAWFARTLDAAGATVAFDPDPVALPKARKNPTEIAGAREAHRLDGIALTRFLFWLSQHGPGHSETELAAKLDGFRRDSARYVGESFPAISAAGPNGAIMHYRPEAATARRLGTNEVYLIDSGGQYECGTTDVTRTVWTGPDQAPNAVRERATRVLAGHLALTMARFPAGITGNRLDTLARAPLWAIGLDFDHGTGHGVGSFLAVHEGPCSIGPKARPVAVEAGMILSNEPGFYLPGQYGIRLENLVLAREELVADTDGERPVLGFETLTVAPFDRALLVPDLLSAEARTALDAYHSRVEREIGPHLDADGRAWLSRACAPL